MKKYVAGMYLRLSDEDRNKSSAMDNSESIENQERICRQWLAAHPDVELFDIYIDDGCTGLDYDREGYKRLKRDINAGIVNMILVKSLMRFGREQVETLILFKREFVLSNVRFVAVVDNIDYTGPDTDDGISIPVRILLNDYYSKHTSIDIRSALQVKRQEGLFIGSFACYGYIKDPEDKNHLIVDPYAAQVVKRIYALFLYGNNIAYIAQTLSGEGILCPSDYKQQVQNYKFVVAKKLETTHYWTYSTIKKMLKDPVYTGCVVQHKKEKVAYNLKKYRCIPKKDWVIVPNKHEPIISQEDFDKVQQLIAIRTREVTHKNLSPYAGIIFCGDCGRAMSKQQYNGKKGFKYRCGTYARIGKAYCTQHAIYTAQLDLILAKEIKKVIQTISDTDIEKLEKKAVIKEKGLEFKNLSLLRKRIQDLENEKKEMLRMLSKKILSENDFMVYNEEYEKEKILLTGQLAEAEQRLSHADERMQEYKEFVKHFLQYREVKEISRELVINLVERITVFENQKVHIKFLFKNPFED